MSSDVTTNQSPHDGEDTRRYGFDLDTMTDDVPVMAEIVYPDDGRPHAGDGAAPTVFKDKPSLFLVRGLPKQSPVADRWQGQNTQLPVNTPPQLLVGANPFRTRLVIWTDGNNVDVVYLSPRPNNSTGTGSGAMGLAAGSVPFEMRHTGAVYVFAPQGGVVYFYEESLAQ